MYTEKSRCLMQPCFFTMVTRSACLAFSRHLVTLVYYQCSAKDASYCHQLRNYLRYHYILTCFDESVNFCSWCEMTSQHLFFEDVIEKVVRLYPVFLIHLCCGVKWHIHGLNYFVLSLHLKTELYITWMGVGNKKRFRGPIHSSLGYAVNMVSSRAPLLWSSMKVPRDFSFYVLFSYLNLTLILMFM